MHKLIFVALLLIMMACAPLPIVEPTVEPGGIIYLNDNPGLALGRCKLNEFVNKFEHVEVLTQCVPSDYTLYEEVADNSYPMRIEYTGAAYTIRPNGASGGLGYRQSIDLPPGCYVRQLSGFIHFWGGIGETWIQFDLGSDELGKHPIIANGNYLAQVPFRIDNAGTYQLSVFLWLQHPSTTADSYMTFERITVQEVDCE